MRIPPKAPTGRGVVGPHDSPCYLAIGNLFKHKTSLVLVKIGPRRKKKNSIYRSLQMSITYC